MVPSNLHTVTRLECRQCGEMLTVVVDRDAADAGRSDAELSAEQNRYLTAPVAAAFLAQHERHKALHWQAVVGIEIHEFRFDRVVPAEALDLERYEAAERGLGVVCVGTIGRRTPAPRPPDRPVVQPPERRGGQ